MTVDSDDSILDYVVLDAVENETGYDTNRATLPWHPDDTGSIVASYDRIADYTADVTDTGTGPDTDTVVEAVNRLTDAGFLEKELVTRPYADPADVPDRHAVALSVTDRGYEALDAELSTDL